MFQRNLLSARFRYSDVPATTLNDESRRELEIVSGKIKSGEWKASPRSCRLCDGEDFVILSERGRYGLPICKSICKACGLVQSNPDFPHDFYVEFYREHYRKLYLSSLVGSPVDLFRQEVWRGREILRCVRKHVPLKKGDLVLEVGCGAGGILEAFSEQGYRVVGTDYEEDNLRFGREQGLDLHSGSVFDLDLRERPKLVIYSHVLEHIYNPKEELQLIRDILLDDGYFYVEVPGIFNIRKNAFFADFTKYFHLAHICDFTLVTLTHLMRKNGYERVFGDEYVHSIFRKGPIDTSYVSDFDRTLRFMVQTERFRHVFQFICKSRLKGVSVRKKMISLAVRMFKAAGLYDKLRALYWR